MIQDISLGLQEPWESGKLNSAENLNSKAGRLAVKANPASSTRRVSGQRGNSEFSAVHYFKTFAAALVDVELYHILQKYCRTSDLL